MDLREMRTLLGEDQEHDRVVRRSDEIVDLLALVRKKLLAYQGEFAREKNSPFADYLGELTGEMARILKQGIVDIEKSSSMMSPD